MERPCRCVDESVYAAFPGRGGTVSSLDGSLPLEATIPATCGAFGDAQSAAPIGGVETGDASANVNGALVLGSAAAATAALGAGIALRGRRSHTAH